MIEALGLEIAAARKKGGVTQVVLHGGERVGQAGDSWLYRCVVADLNLHDDTPVRVLAGEEDVPGVVVSYRDAVLLLALENDLGPRIETARLVSDKSFLLERLKEHLGKVRAEEIQFNRKAADRVLGLAPPSTADAQPHPSVNRDGRANADQLLAVRRSLGSDTTFVWGPPGTGKTSTLARVVESHYRAGRSVLLVSNTNIAVDTALAKVAERLEHEPDFNQGLVIRQGPVVKEELRRRFGPQVILEEIVARVGEKLQREKDDLFREEASLEAEEQSLVSALRDLEQLASTRETFVAHRHALETAKTSIAAGEREARQHRARASKAAADRERARKMSRVRRYFSGLDPEHLAREAAAADRAAQAAFQAAWALASDLPRLEAEIAALGGAVGRLTAETQSHPPAAQIHGSLSSLRTRLEQIREGIPAIDRQLADVEQQVLARCRVLATTVYRTYLGTSRARQFDVVVIDEASMLVPPLVYYAAGLANTSVTVAGDFRQLPPIVMSDEPLATEWLKRDVFEKAGIPQGLAQQRPMPHLVALGTQYRMREPICALVNKLFYADHPLRSDPSVNRGGGRFPLSDAPLLYVDTASFRPWAAFRAGTYSRYNLLHAHLVWNIVLHLAETGFLPEAGKPNEAVGVVTPYAAQARYVQHLLAESLGERAAGIAATVHRFQGNEKTVMVLDLTDSWPLRLGRFLRATQIQEDGARLLNVAATRARRHVILVGNFEYLRAKAPRHGFVRRLVDHVAEQGEALSPDALLTLAGPERMGDLQHVLPGTSDFPARVSGPFNEDTFPPAFLEDLARAHKSILIVSGFMTEKRTRWWLDSLRAARARGVEVRILTPPPEDHKRSLDRTAVQHLRNVGITVNLRTRTHEKIAILDGRLLWHGSLNILSYGNKHEKMLRMDSPALCQEFSRTFSPPVGRRGAETIPSLDARQNPACPICGGPTIWNDEGPSGPHFKCEDAKCKGKVDLRRRQAHARQRAGGQRRGERT